jgi:hypothetical protein
MGCIRCYLSSGNEQFSFHLLYGAFMPRPTLRFFCFPIAISTTWNERLIKDCKSSWIFDNPPSPAYTEITTEDFWGDIKNSSNVKSYNVSKEMKSSKSTCLRFRFSFLWVKFEVNMHKWWMGILRVHWMSGQKTRKYLRNLQNEGFKRRWKMFGMLEKLLAEAW